MSREDVVGEGEVKNFSNINTVNIPDNDEKGAYSAITISEEMVVGELEVTIKIDHTWIGDLQVILEKDGVEVILHNQTGGSADGIEKTYKVKEFTGANLRGEWKLKVLDSAEYDTGSIMSWSISNTAGR